MVTSMHSYDYPRPALTADVIALTLHQGALKVLMIERAHPPALSRAMASCASSYCSAKWQVS